MQALRTQEGLSERQVAFVNAIVSGIPPATAAEVAGYTGRGVSAAACLRSPTVQAAIVEGLRRFLLTEAAPAAFQVMFRFMNDETVDKKIRLAAAKTLADRAGFIAPKASENKDLGNKSPVDMSAHELREMAQRIQKELSDRATVVIDHSPQSSQPTDIFD